MNFAGKAVYHIVQYPAADHAVKRQQDKTSGHAHTADPRPLRTRAQCFEGIDGVFTARTADVKFGQLNRQGYQNRKNQKQKKKYGAAVCTGRIREFPNCTQTDGRACRSKHKADFG